MGIISVDSVKPGMVLAEKVLTPKNMMLLPEGVTITEGHMVTFKTWGITEVNIVGEGADEEGAVMTEEEREALEKEVRHIFKHNNTEKGFAQALFAIACRTQGA